MVIHYNEPTQLRRPKAYPTHKQIFIVDALIPQKLDESMDCIRRKISTNPRIAIVLGSGLGPLADMIENPVRVPYSDIPHFVSSTVSGHAGEFVFGRHAGADVVCMNGRFHYYEGYTLQEITYPTRVMSQLGAENLILTNAAGGVNASFSPGDLMILNDHINLIGDNPLIGANFDTLGPRFPDMTEVYSRRLRQTASLVAERLGIPTQEGVYAALSGPSYETPAEIRMLRVLGVDAVGMSTVPEAIVARHMGMTVLAISCITNMAAGMSDTGLSHEEVTQTAERITSNFTRLISGVIEKIAPKK